MTDDNTAPMGCRFPARWAIEKLDLATDQVAECIRREFIIAADAGQHSSPRLSEAERCLRLLAMARRILRGLELEPKAPMGETEAPSDADPLTGETYGEEGR